VPRTGCLCITPLPGFTGTDSFDYQRCSTHAPQICATATVTVDVVARPTPPVPPNPPVPPRPPRPGWLPDTGVGSGLWQLTAGGAAAFLAGVGMLRAAALQRRARSRKHAAADRPDGDPAA
jgi:hypothetical protein